MIASLISAIAQDADKDIGLTALTNYHANKKAINAAQQNINRVRQQGENIKNYIADYYANNGVSQSTSEDDVKDYVAALKDYDPNEFVYDVDKFSFTDENGNEKTADDYYDENASKILGNAMAKVLSGATGGGLGRSLGSAKDVTQAVIDKDESLRNSAQAAYNAERQQAYNEWNAYTTQKQNQLNQLANATNKKIQNLGNIATLYQQNKQNEFEDTLNAQIFNDASLNSAYGAKANAGTADAGAFSFLL